MTPTSTPTARRTPGSLLRLVAPVVAALMLLALPPTAGAEDPSPLAAPVLLGSGQSGTTLTAEKTATAHYTKTFAWSIDKSVTPDTLDLFKGDSAVSTYTVAVTKDAGTVEAWIGGQICVTNGGAVATENLAIVDEVTMPPATTVIASVNVDTTAHPVLAPGETHCYDYSVDVPVGGAAGKTYKDTAHITITNHSGHLDTPFGPDPSATSVMPSSPTLVNDTINVDDTNGSSWQFSASGSESYTKTFACDADKGANKNTATIRETGQSDSASVTVNCYALTVSKDAKTSFDRKYNWTIAKSADQSSLTLALGQSFLVNYSVTVGLDAASPYVDSNHAVAGTITVENPAPIPAVINDVTDVISPDVAAAVDCEVSFPYTLAAGKKLECSYSSALPDGTDRTNTATATLQNHSYDADGGVTDDGTTDFSGTANVGFAGATMNEQDACITVSDTLGGSLGTVCRADAPKTFTYAHTVGPYGSCGDYTVDNTATFTTTDSGATGDAKWMVNVHVPCGGCSLTIGYWKTHAGLGPQADMVTKLLAITLGTSGGAKSVQVTTAAQAVAILGMSGDASNGINKLYAQLLGAKLNIAAGASGSVIATTIAAADEFLATHNAANWLTLSKADKSKVLSWATTLDQYNNGLIGPGHCSQ